MLTLADLETPAALIDCTAMQRNIVRMQTRMNELRVAFRPHVKTAKCLPIARAQLGAGARGITVSTLKEAQTFFADGIQDIVYAVGIAPNKLGQVASLRAQGCALKIVVDSLAAAQAVRDYSTCSGCRFEVLIEIDTDGHRAGVLPHSDLLLDVGRCLASVGALKGVLTHAGGSYALADAHSLQAMADQERSGCVAAAQRLRAAQLPCDVVSVGSTPTALSAMHYEGVTEVRAGVYVFFDLVMQNIGVCTAEDLAMSVLTTVIGHQRDKAWVIVDAGWMAMSRDRGTQTQNCDYGYGQVCDVQGRPLQGYLMHSANQEHGIIARVGAGAEDVEQRFALGSLLRILPNHACATAAQFPQFHAITDAQVKATWPRIYGW